MKLQPIGHVESPLTDRSAAPARPIAVTVGAHS